MSGLATMAGAQSLAQPPSAPAPVMRWSTSTPGPRLSHPATEGAGPCEPPCNEAAPIGRQRAVDAARSHSRLLAGLTAAHSIGGGGGGNAAAGALGGGTKAGGLRAGGSLIDRLASAVECGRTPPPALPAPPAARAAFNPITPCKQRGASDAGRTPPCAAASLAEPGEAGAAARPAPDAPPRPARQSPPGRAARAADPTPPPHAPPKETPAEYMARLKQELDPDAFARVEELLRAFRKARRR